MTLRSVVLASAALLVAATLATPAAAQPKDAPTASPDQRAIDLYTEGRSLLSAGKPADALPKLTESLELLPSPNTELLIAHANRELGRLAHALRAYAHVIEAAQAGLSKGQDKYKDALGEAERWQTELLPSIGTLVVAGPPGLTVEVRGPNGALPAKSGDKVYVDPGEMVVAAISGGRSDVQRVRVEKGGVLTVTFAEKGPATEPAVPPPTTGNPARDSDGGGGVFVSIPGIIVGSVGLAALGVSGGFGGAALALHGDLESCTAGQPCAATFDDDKSTGETYKLITNVTLGVGLGLVAAGATIWIIQAMTDDGDAAPTKAAVGVAPMFDSDGRLTAGSAVFGRF